MFLKCRDDLGAPNSCTCSRSMCVRVLKVTIVMHNARAPWLCRSQSVVKGVNPGQRPGASRNCKTCAFRQKDSAKSDVTMRKAPKCSKSGNNRIQSPLGGGGQRDSVGEQPRSPHLKEQWISHNREEPKASHGTQANPDGGGATGGLRREQFG